MRVLLIYLMGLSYLNIYGEHNQLSFQSPVVRAASSGDSEAMREVQNLFFEYLQKNLESNNTTVASNFVFAVVLAAAEYSHAKTADAIDDTYFFNLNFLEGLYYYCSEHKSLESAKYTIIGTLRRCGNMSAYKSLSLIGVYENDPEFQRLIYLYLIGLNEKLNLPEKKLFEDEANVRRSLEKHDRINKWRNNLLSRAGIELNKKANEPSVDLPK